MNTQLINSAKEEAAVYKNRKDQQDLHLQAISYGFLIGLRSAAAVMGMMEERKAIQEIINECNQYETAHA